METTSPSCSVAKPSRTTPAAVLFAALTVAGMASSASAQTTFIKANNTTSLNLAGSYTSNSGTPTSIDTLQIDSTLIQTNPASTLVANLGGNVSVAGITQLANATRAFQFNNTANTTLSIGAGGITKSSTANLVLNSFTTLADNQAWAIAAGSMQLPTSFGLNTNGKTLAVTGAGTLDVRTSLTLGSNVTIDSNVGINSRASTLVLGGANTFNTLSVFAGKVSGATLGNFGQTSNFGDGSSSTAIVLGSNGSNGVLDYTGTTATSNRTVNRDARSGASGINVTAAGETLTLSGALGSGQVNTGNNGWAFGGPGNLTLTGVISNATGAESTGTTLTKSDQGTLTLGGANSYTGITSVNGGKLAISANERIANASDLNLAGGTFALGSFTETLDTLNLSASSVIELGTGGKALFADSSGVIWAEGATLSIAGSFVSGASIQFGASNAGLSLGQLSQIRIAGFGGVGLDSAGFLTASAVPEPATYAALAGLGILGFAVYRRRRV